MTLSAGAKLGPYEVLSFIRAGGMGEVYRARDPRLNRDVAIKDVVAANPLTGLTSHVEIGVPEPEED